MRAKRKIFRSAIALNYAIREGSMGLIAARLSYMIWDLVWEAYMRCRSVFQPSIADFEIHGRVIKMDLSDPTVTRALYIFGEYESDETTCLIGLLQPGMTFVDIGANTGYYTLITAQLVTESGHVFAFEPCQENAEILARNVELNGLSNVTIEQLAIADKSARLTLHKSIINAGDHRIYNGHDDPYYNLGRTRSKEEVNAVKLDDQLATWRRGLDVIKMDIQGSEADAINGMRKSLVENEEVVLMTEYWPHGIERSGSTPAKLLGGLHDLGFNPYIPGAVGKFIPVSYERLAKTVSGRDSLTLFFSRNGLLSMDPMPESR